MDGAIVLVPAGPVAVARGLGGVELGYIFDLYHFTLP